MSDHDTERLRLLADIEATAAAWAWQDRWMLRIAILLGVLWVLSLGPTCRIHVDSRPAMEGAAR